MNTKIIFVDDDPMLLASTRRQLHRKVANCQMLFVDSAKLALEAMKEQPVDIILTDLRMPEMDGAELLTLIAKEYPDTIRLAWTGQSETEKLKKVCSVAHQVFSKPCPTKTLVEIINTVSTICRLPLVERMELLPKALAQIEIVDFLGDADQP